MKNAIFYRTAFLSLCFGLVSNQAEACIRKTTAHFIEGSSFIMRNDAFEKELFGGKVLAAGADSKVGLRPWLSLRNEDSLDCASRMYQIEKPEVPMNFQVSELLLKLEAKAGSGALAEWRVIPSQDAETGHHPISVRVSTDDPQLDLELNSEMYINKDVTNMVENMSPSLSSAIPSGSRSKIEYSTNIKVAYMTISASSGDTGSTIEYAACRDASSCSITLAASDIPADKIRVSVSLKDSAQGVYHSYYMIYNVQDGGSVSEPKGGKGSSSSRRKSK